MTNEFDERFSECLPDSRVRRQDVENGKKREEHTDADDFQTLEQHIFPPEARQSFVPNGRQQLLHIRVGNKLTGNSICNHLSHPKRHL